MSYETTNRVMEYRIYGGSDDLAEVTVVHPDGKADLREFDAFDCRWAAELRHGSTGLRVHLSTDEGCWMIGVCQLNEDTLLPAWQTRITQANNCSYSAELQILCPEGTELRVVEP